ncbi:PadR family transcriptional regulator [Dictyobacter halimunensis]|uniref:PadR family transcriptional regulator n=1 Tax=Dictyobacter halimunensis TaxID=3026934 RepID=UPI0030C6B803
MRTFELSRGPWFGPARGLHSRTMHMSREHGDPRGEGFGESRHPGRRGGRRERPEEFGRHEQRSHRGFHGEEFGEIGPREHPGRHHTGPLGPEHRGPRGRRGERGGPRIGRGDVRSATLLLLSEQPSHGYQIIQQVGERSGGLWQPSPGSVYPALQMLEDEGAGALRRAGRSPRLQID